MMEPRSVLISYKLDSSKNPFSCSGTLISESWVLAHGSLLEPLVLQSDDLRSLTDGLGAGVLAINRRVEKSPEFAVSWEEKNAEVRSPPCCGAKVLPNVNNTSEKSSCSKSTSFVIKNARLIGVWKCPLLAEVFEGILSSWRFSENPRSDNVTVADKEIFPLFLMLKIQDAVSTTDSSISELQDVLTKFTKILATPQRGQEIEIESTPFGNPVFMNSVANGIVSNVLGKAKALILTDANAVIGCEGGPIFVRYKSGYRAVCGIVVAPLSWCRGEWVGYTLGVSLLPCLHRVLRNTDENNNFAPPVSGSGIVELVDKSVVVVRCGSGWGSGVLLNKTSGLYLTCSHVVKEAPDSRITISNPNFSTRGELVYKTPGDKSYDLAIVRVDPRQVSSTQELPMKTAPTRKRDEIVCAGFPLISSRDQPLMFPTITRGKVSHVAPGMLQTTCCIQSGTSGGPVISYPGGELVGIVVCNATSAGSKALFPHVNMAVPSRVFKHPIEEYLRTKDLISLQKLENKDVTVQRTWNLNLTPLSNL